MRNDHFKPLRPLFVLFLLLNAFFLLANSWLTEQGLDTRVLITGNVILLLVILVSFILTRRSFDDPNPNVFVRAVYAGFILKFFVIAVAAFAYIMAVRDKVNKPALIACMGLYVVYTIIEVRALLQLLKQKKNG